MCRWQSIRPVVDAVAGPALDLQLPEGKYYYESQE
jgi:hypothetical protein